MAEGQSAPENITPQARSEGSSSSDTHGNEAPQDAQRLRKEYLDNLVVRVTDSQLPQTGIRTDERGSFEVPTVAAESVREADAKLEDIGTRLRALGEELPTEEQARVVILKRKLRTDPDGKVLNNGFNREILDQIAKLEGEEPEGAT